MPINDRQFKVPEAILLQHAEVVAKMFPTDSADFVAFDATISAEYGNTIKNSINAVIELKSDQIIIDEMAEYTQHVLNAMSDCNLSYKTIAYFVRKAFKKDTAVQNQFGFNDIEMVRKSQPKLVLFMEQHAGTATKYKDHLVSAGCNEEIINQLLTNAEELKAANAAQEEFKKERGVITQERVKRLNHVYELVKPLNDIAQIIYSEDPARMAKYTLPKPKSSQNTPDDLIES
jgi:hypothetical protein